MEHGKVTLEVNDGVGLLTLNDPSTLNAWGELMRRDFAAALDRIEAPDSGVRSLIITGAGR